MAAELVTAEIGTNSTHEKRIELVLDLTRRLELLDDLLRTSRARRCSTETGMEQAELDDNADTSTTAVAQPWMV
jgi:hypothetical protein